MYSMREFGIRNNAHSVYGFISECTFCPFHAICWEVHPPNLPRNKGERLKRWKSERMQRLYKEQKANNAVHLPLYWNVLRFFLYNYWVPPWYKLLNGYAAHPLPFLRGEREGITYTELTYPINKCCKISKGCLFGHKCPYTVAPILMSSWRFKSKR